MQVRVQGRAQREEYSEAWFTYPPLGTNRATTASPTDAFVGVFTGLDGRQCRATITAAALHVVCRQYRDAVGSVEETVLLLDGSI